MNNIINPFANKGRIVTGKNFIGRFEGLKTCCQYSYRFTNAK
ncbi:Uncharacterized protein dnl_31910 [Desulfonema limicola]|uniref:Uncharacterized protein n=1 Tax=Desulfonema limicola TaxID=45656 RepID=A0A975GH32_9BACT|nr:Uncharacterized protein dnl_31910 [Desulfonema limicola]